MALLLSGVLLQALGCWLFAAGGRLVALALLLLLGGAALSGWALGRRRGSADRDTFLFALVLALFIPVLGPLGVALTFVVRDRSPRTELRSVQLTCVPALPVRPLSSSTRRHFGPGSLEGLLRYGRSVNDRVRAVVACRPMEARAAVPLLRVALRDAADDVRLLAYAVLDGRERDLRAQIQTLAGKLPSATPAAQGFLHGRLAALYWELAYQGLVEGELLTHALGALRVHAESARRLNRYTPGLALLVGRSHLRERRAPAARVALQDALDLGMPAAVVNPHLAEAAFLDRRLRDVRDLLRPVQAAARDRGRLGAIAELWS